MVRRQPLETTKPRKTSFRLDQRTPDELQEEQLEQVVGGVGSQSTGAGGGRASFPPITIAKRVDKTSP